MPRNSNDVTFDYSLRLKDAGLVAASAAATVASVAKILDMGASRFDGRAVIDLTACEVATGNEQYIIIVQGSTSSSFGSGIVNLGAVLLGDSSVSLESADTAAVTRREIFFSNEVDGTLYRYVRLYTFVAGTIATGINYAAFLAKAS